jgi:mannose-6-phosphate isomerase
MLTGPTGSMPLPQLIADDPAGVLGGPAVARFGPRLPYLLKFLAAAQPLSLQVHPDAEQARAGYERENATDAAVRNYVDPYHKPELLVALEPFDALCGFRDPDESAEVLAGFEVPRLKPVIEALRTGSAELRLRTAVQRLFALGPDVVADVRTATSHPLVALLGEGYPDDVGVIMALLLNRFTLQPGEGVFVPAGTMHAYLSGVGIEVMAASDNVLRGGLTPKHVDTDELARILRYEALEPPVVRPEPLTGPVSEWPTPTAEFSLTRAEPGTSPAQLGGEGPRILLCVRGTAHLRCGDERLDLARGESVFVAAHEPAVTVTGRDATVFQAAPGTEAGPIWAAKLPSALGLRRARGGRTVARPKR